MTGFKPYECTIELKTKDPKMLNIWHALAKELAEAEARKRDRFFSEMYKAACPLEDDE